MFKFDKSDIQRIAVSSMGAIALSATCILGAAGPVRAETPAQNWKGAVEQQLDQNSAAYASDVVPETRVAVRFDADGRFQSAKMIRSSFNPELDGQAIAVARTIAYPVLPADQNHTVVLRLLHGASPEQVAAERAKDATVRYANAASGAGGKVLAK